MMMGLMISSPIKFESDLTLWKPMNFVLSFKSRFEKNDAGMQPD